MSGRADVLTMVTMLLILLGIVAAVACGVNIAPMEDETRRLLQVLLAIALIILALLLVLGYLPVAPPMDRYPGLS